MTHAEILKLLDQRISVLQSEVMQSKEIPDPFLKKHMLDSSLAKLQEIELLRIILSENEKFEDISRIFYFKVR